jgi:hypothetical protein
VRKLATKVTTANGGMHNPSGFTKAKKMLEACKYQEARLYHLAFTDSTTVKPYQEALKAICEKLRTHGEHGIPCQWKACCEHDSSRGFHMHVYLLVEAKFNNPAAILNRISYGWLIKLANQLGINIYINHPRDPLHWGASGKTLKYATIPKSKPEKLANCIEWISYLYKVRSKEGLLRIYSSSRPSRATES